MKKSLLSLIVLLMLLSASAMAQTVTGRVTAATDGAPLPGVSILVKGTSSGTSTDADGKYSINISDKNAILVVSFVGFATQEVAVGSNLTLDIVLQEEKTQLGEVVITALGVARDQKTLVYATQSVKASELNEVRDANNVLNSLQGKIANAVITQGSGGPGSGARIVLRGNRSIQGSNNALIVVDGVPITNGTNGTVTSDFGGLQGSDGASNINPDDIASMTILRGASAAALYGSQAGNGVILITTKKGSKDKVSVNVNSGLTTETPFILPAFQNTYGQGDSGVKDPTMGADWGSKLDGSPIQYSGLVGNAFSRSYSAQKSNVRDFFRTGLSLNNSFGVSGGTEKAQTYLSYTNNKVQGIMPRNDLNRHTITLRLTNQISKKFSTDGKVTYILQNIDRKYSTGEGGPLMELYQIPRNVALNDAKNFEYLDPTGNPRTSPYPVINAALYQNPYWIVHRSENNEKRDRIMGFLSAKYDLTDWLHLTGRANLDKMTDHLENIQYQGTLGIPPDGGGSYGTTLIDVTQKWFDVVLNGSNKITDDLKIDYRAGAILQDNQYTSSYSSANGLNVTNIFSLNFATNRDFGQSATHVQTQSVYGQANLAWKEAIFLDASVRNDWDSRLPKPYTILYPSIGLSGIISDLVTLPSAFSFLKVSGNYAVVGNGGQPQIRFNTYGYSQGSAHGFISRGLTQAIPNLKPELVKNVEVGIDAKFMQNRLGFTLTAYRSNSYNQLLQVNLPVATGFSAQYINAGNIQNQGLELFLNATPVKGDLTWDISFNMGMNRNKVISLTPQLTEVAVSSSGFGRSATPVIKVGGSYGDMEGFVWKKDPQGRNIVTPNGTPLSTITTGDYGNLGNFNPKATTGITNTITYKRLSARLLIDGRIGGVIVDGTEQLLAYSGHTKATESYREGGWNLGGVVELDPKNNPGVFTPSNKTISSEQFWTTASGGRYGSAEFFTYDATNFRIRELSIAYKIPVPSNLFIKSARFSVVTRNLLFLYRGYAKLAIPGLPKRKMGFDPDMQLGNGNWQGVSYGTMPSTRSIGFNLQLSF